MRKRSLLSEQPSYVCLYVSIYRLTETTKKPINTSEIGKVLRNRTGNLALPVPWPAGLRYREPDPQSQILKANSFASHNHPPVLGLKKTFHTVQCSSNKPNQIDRKSTMIASVQVQINIVHNVSHFFFEGRACN
jgi:hypothetical protein